MPDGDGWKETFKFFVKELTEVYLPQLKDVWDLVLPVPSLQGEPEKAPGAIPQPVPAPQPPFPPLPEISEMGPMQPVFPRYQVAGEPPIPYDPPPELPDRTPFPPWDPQLPYGYDAGTPTPLQIEPGPPTPWWTDIFPKSPAPWWREVPPEIYQYGTHFVQAPPPVDLERKV